MRRGVGLAVARAGRGRRAARPSSSLARDDDPRTASSLARDDDARPASLRALAAADPTSLDLSASEALMCTNLMCEHVGDRCGCKLALWLERRALPSLETLSLRGNDLRFVPDAVFRLAALRTLDLADNKLAELPGAVAGLGALEVLDVSGNDDLARLPAELWAMPRLREVRTRGDLFAAPPGWAETDAGLVREDRGRRR